MTDMSVGDLRRRATAVSSDLGPAGISAAARILTAKGERRLGDLAPDDRIISRGSGMIRLTGVTRFSCRQAPVVIAPGALGDGQPSETLHLCPAQMLLLRDWRARLVHGAKAMLASAESLIDHGYITRSPRLIGMEMVRLHFAAPQILYINGIECAVEPEVQRRRRAA